MPAPSANADDGAGTSGKDRLIHRLFAIGIFGKAIDGVLEVLGGALLLSVNAGQINRLLHILTQHELSEDPRDVVAGFLVRWAQHLSADTRLFAALFLLWHGTIKLGLAAALLRKLWSAYPIAMAAFGLFVIYQLYRYSHTGSIWLLALSLLDLLLIALTWLEYRRMRS